MISSNVRRERAAAIAVGALLASAAAAGAAPFELTGHLKSRLLGATFPSDSVFRDLGDATAIDAGADMRLNFAAGRGRWSFDGAWQLFAAYGDTVALERRLLADGLAPGPPPGDDRRLFDLFDTLRDDGRFNAVQRVDRLAVSYATATTVLRAGRQALTWGNGFFYAPLDVVNPFDPAAVDTEFKAGDDMLYGQYLKANGHDVEAAVVLRREPVSGDVRADEATAAVRYNGLAEDGEYQLMLARNYGDALIGLGGNRALGGAVWRADLAVSEAGDWTTEFVTNLSYSWQWWGRNVSGVVEYYFNGFGLHDGRYGPAELASAPELTARLTRGQSFTVGRHYLAGGITVEVTPLTLVTPNLFANLGDKSALLQLVVQHSLGDNLTFLGALNLPVGPRGSEYGGLESPLPGRYFSRSAALFAQLAWYF